MLSVDATDVGLYECHSGTDDFKLSETYLYVDTGGKEMIVPPTEQERIVNVVSKRTALLPCRYFTILDVAIH